MIQDSRESVPEIHVNEDTDFRMTTLLLELQETSVMDGSGCEPEITGSQHHAGCCWSPSERSSRDSPNKIPCSLDGNSTFPLSSCTPDYYSCEKKQTRRNEELHKKSLDLALAKDSCIGRGTYAYLPGNGCYGKHKKLVRRLLRKTSSKGKFAQERDDDEDCDPQTLVEFQVYLSKLEPVANPESGDGCNRTLQVKESVGRLDDERANAGLTVQKSSSADVTVPRKVIRSSLPDVRARSSSGHYLSVHGRIRQDDELDRHAEDAVSTAGAADLAWDTRKGGRLAKSGRADDSAVERESRGVMLDGETTKKIKEIKKSITWSDLSSDDGRKNGGGVFTHSVPLTTDTTTRNIKKKTKRHDTRIDTDSAVPLARLPLTGNQYLHKPNVYHLSSLVTGPCFGPHQPTLPKESLRASDRHASSMSSVLGSSSQHSLALRDDFCPILEGRKIRTKRPNFRFL